MYVFMYIYLYGIGFEVWCGNGRTASEQTASMHSGKEDVLSADSLPGTILGLFRHLVLTATHCLQNSNDL